MCPRWGNDPASGHPRAHQPPLGGGTSPPAWDGRLDALGQRRRHLPSSAWTRRREVKQGKSGGSVGTTDQGKGKGSSVVRPMGTVAYRGKGQGKGKGRGEGRSGQGGRGRSKGGDKLMGTTAYGGKGSKGRAANGDRPVGAATCRRDYYTMASCQNPPEPEASVAGVGEVLVQALTQVCRSLKRKEVEWRKKGNPKRVWWIDSVEEFMQPVCYEEELIAQCKASAEVGDFVAMYPSMDQEYVSTNVLEAIEEAWDWEEQIAKEAKDGEEEEELWVGKDGWRLGRNGEEPLADSRSKRSEGDGSVGIQQRICQARGCGVQAKEGFRHGAEM